MGRCSNPIFQTDIILKTLHAGGAAPPLPRSLISDFSQVLQLYDGIREGFKNPSHGIRPLGGYPPHA